MQRQLAEPSLLKAFLVYLERPQLAIGNLPLQDYHFWCSEALLGNISCLRCDTLWGAHRDIVMNPV